ncbi:MAG: type II toxin-antitoxin system VapC family toxin [bacterium]|nr:type II toxin-antitoxin system VapC family toxin [bacterium]
MKIFDALRNITILAIETAPFIYYVENHPVYSNKINHIFQIIEANGIKITTSAITLTETLMKPMKVGDLQVENNYRELLTRHKTIQLFSVTPNIAENAARLRARYNLRTPDALHIATAIESKSDAFLTNDLALKRIVEVRVLILDELEIN